MFRSLLWLAALTASGMLLPAHAEAAGPMAGPNAVVCPRGASRLERFAAKEIRRYVYLRSGTLLPVVDDVAAEHNQIVVGSKGQPWVERLVAGLDVAGTIKDLGPEQYLLKTVYQEHSAKLLVTGGDSVGTLYGAYRLAERLGVRFYLHGDAVPDLRSMSVTLRLDEVGKPLFDRRGIQPFHDFPEGPDWWNADGYKAVLGQLPKLRMNFFGLHTYPQGGVGPEPAVWIGRAADLGPDGRVKASYPSRHFTTLNGTWGYAATKTGDYLFGAAALYDRDDYGVDYMRGMTPWPGTPADCNALFDRMGAVLGDAFGFARRLGIKTCVGTETPLVLPDAVRQRLKADGLNPKDPAVVQSIYAAMFERIAKTHPVDYYWFWTPEAWTWQPVRPEQVEATQADLRAAIAAAAKVKAPFTLATCGWVLGPPQTPSLFDETLPKDMPMSCISRQVGNAPVEPGFAKVEGRPKWSIPWMEDDPGLILPQLWVGRMRRDAADSLAYGCTGLMGIHWRTRVLAPNVAALAAAAWNQDGWNPDRKPAAPSVKPPEGTTSGKPRYLQVDDFYAGWAWGEFGPEAARPIAAVFSKLDGHLPRPADWIDGPGGIRPDKRPWEQVRDSYQFVDALVLLRLHIRGAGNLERFDYWLNTFRYLRAIGQLDCTWGRYDAAMVAVRAEKNAEVRGRMARERALPIRRELVAQAADVQQFLMATVSTYGELGTVTNWQQHIFPRLLARPGEELAKLLGGPLPDDAMPSRRYRGARRLIVPVVRTALVGGEPLVLTVLVLGGEPTDGVVRWRPLGAGPLAATPLVHVARGVYSVTLPPAAVRADLEYYIEATVGDKKIHWPATAPQLNQSVVVD